MTNEKEIEKNTIALGELVNGLVDKKLQKIKMKIDKIFDNHSQQGSEQEVGSQETLSGNKSSTYVDNPTDTLKIFENHSQDGSEYPIKNSSIASARHPETSGVNSDFPKTLDETPEEENKKEIGK